MTPQEAFITPSGCLFNVEKLHWMDLNKKEPLVLRQSGRGYLKIFQPILDKGQYILAADTSFGASKDYSVAVVLEKKTKSMVATLRGKYGSRDFTKHIVKLGKFYNNALIAVERNAGQAVLNQLIHVEDYRNLYYNEEYDEFKIRTLKPGFYTSTQSRNLILDSLVEAIDSETLKIEDENFISECLSFGFVKKRFEARSGNDDCVMALAIGNYLCDVPAFVFPENLEKPVGI